MTVTVTAARPLRTERASSTREAILTAAERLYAEHGVFAVSNRQVSEAAGQGNNAAVGYHFGTKTDLVRAIEQRHREPIEQIRGRLSPEKGLDNLLAAAPEVEPKALLSIWTMTSLPLCCRKNSSTLSSPALFSAVWPVPEPISVRL